MTMQTMHFHTCVNTKLSVVCKYLFISFPIVVCFAITSNDIFTEKLNRGILFSNILGLTNFYPWVGFEGHVHQKYLVLVFLWWVHCLQWKCTENTVFPCQPFAQITSWVLIWYEEERRIFNLVTSELIFIFSTPTLISTPSGHLHLFQPWSLTLLSQ